MSHPLTDAVWREIRSNPLYGYSSAERLVLLALADRTNGEGRCWPSVPLLASDTGLSVRTVQRGLSRLQAMGVVGSTARQADSGAPTTNCYALTMTPGVTMTPPPGDTVTPRGDSVSPPSRHSDTTPGDTVTPRTGKYEPGQRTGDVPSLARGSRARTQGKSPTTSKRTSEVDDAFKADLVAKYSEALGGEEVVLSHIEQALAHKAASKYTDLRAYCRNWVGRDAREAQRRAVHQPALARTVVQAVPDRWAREKRALAGADEVAV